MQGPNNIQSERIINSAITNFKHRMKWLFFLVLAITPILIISSYLRGNVDLKVLLFVMLLWAVFFIRHLNRIMNEKLLVTGFLYRARL
jgi:hypothetical protein